MLNQKHLKLNQICKNLAYKSRVVVKDITNSTAWLLFQTRQDVMDNSLKADSMGEERKPLYFELYDSVNRNNLF